MKQREIMDIGEVSRRSGLPASTLRYYEEKGLIRSVGRHGLRRLFDSSVLNKLALIALGRNASFTLNEIGAMFTAEGRLQIDRDRLLERANELDQNIKQLTAMRNGLRHVAKCQAPSHLECPKFLRLLRTASSKPVMRQTQLVRKSR